jgi:two-component SAPR family response regulator
MRDTLDLPTGYQLRREPDILSLCRSDGSIVASFSSAANPNEVRKVAEEDRYQGTVDDQGPPISDAVTDRPYLWVRFFGHFEILCNDEPVDLGRNGKALAIFKYLLAHRKRRVSRDHLMGWLWPEFVAKRGRLRLAQAPQ